MEFLKIAAVLSPMSVKGSLIFPLSSSMNFIAVLSGMGFVSANRAENSFIFMDMLMLNTNIAIW